jgi:GNAT superfamily N-acetyltransferase
MEKTRLLELFDKEQRVEAEWPGSQRDANPRSVRFFNPEFNEGFVAYSHLDETNADAEIEAQIAFFLAKNAGFEWKYYDYDTPTDLPARLLAHGFQSDEPEALMVLDMHKAPDFYWSMPLPPMQNITTEAGVMEVMKMKSEVWNEDLTELGRQLVSTLQEHPDRMEMFAVMDGNRIVSAARIEYHPGTHFAGLWGGSTLKEYRGRGYYTALLAVRARRARELGYRFLTVDASSMSRPILEKHGFQILGVTTPYHWKPEGK